MRTDAVGRKKRTKASGEQVPPPSKATALTDALRTEIRAWAREAADVNDVRVFELEMSASWQMTLSIERPGRVSHKDGVTIDECIRVSRYLEGLLDVDDRVPERYRLDVSSPGLERRLKTPEQLELSIGRLVRVVLRESDAGKEGAVKQGTLRSFENGSLFLELSDEQTAQIPWADVARAKLTFEF
jgi:ribosome maturation factor RimP